MKWELNKLDSLFTKMSKDGLDTSSSLQWGFTFMALYKSQLNKVFNELEDYGYILSKMEYREQLSLWILYVTKVEILTYDKLHKRNLAFEELADYLGIHCYDGWDVQKIEDPDVESS